MRCNVERDAELTLPAVGWQDTYKRYKKETVVGMCVVVVVASPLVCASVVPLEVRSRIKDWYVVSDRGWSLQVIRPGWQPPS